MPSQNKPHISIAPMMAWTDRHFRYFMRLISPHTVLYTEMITTGALIHSDPDRYLLFNKEEHPVALQLGGSDPKELAHCAKLGEQAGYDEINLNVGCPSDRVQKGRIGACLMKEPDLVAECISEMCNNVNIPVTVKTRIGVDDQDSYEALQHFVKTVHAAGCDTFIIHARKAWLKGLNPRQNRSKPPLCYDTVYQIKQDNPNLRIIINGGIKLIENIEKHLKHIDGAMLGREAYRHPYLFAEIEKHFFKNNPLSREEVLERYTPYISQSLEQGARLNSLVKPLYNLYKGQPGAKAWRQRLASGIIPA
ncbi:MAG: tRNA dihydrouridine(20/20a) synthase DusA [Gammaproteobacteria bacterium]